MEKLIILLPVYNRIKITKKCIECIKNQTYQNFILLLIDDGSTDGTADMVLAEVPETVVIRGKGKWWWAGSLQQGINWIKRNNLSKDDFVVILNDDVEFDTNFFDTAISILKDKKKTLLLAQSFSQQTGELVDSGVHVDWENLKFEQAKNPDNINCLSTMGLFFRIEDMLFIGSFHPRLLPHYGSDYEYTIRAYNKGYKLITDSRLKLALNVETTGIHSIKEKSVVKYIKKVFSKKSVYNPFMWLVFIVLSCPKGIKLKTLFIGTKRFIAKSH